MSFEVKSCLDNRNGVNHLLRRAEKNYKIGNYDLSLSICNEILTIFPANSRALKIKRKISKQQKRSGNHKASIVMVDSLLANNNLPQAENLVCELIETDPENMDLWILLGTIYRDSNKLSYALQCFNKALSFSQEAANVYYEIGKTLSKANDLGNAYKSFQVCLSLLPEDSKTLTEIGLIYDKIKNYEKAQNAWTKAIASDNSNHHALTLLGIYAMQKDGNAEEALKYFKPAVQMAPNDIHMYNNIVCAYLDLGEHEKIRNLFTEFKSKQNLKISQETRRLLNFSHGLALISLGEIEEGWQLYRDRVYIPNVLHVNVDKIKITRLKSLDDASGKRILVLREQGVGDQIYFLGSLKQFAIDNDCQIILDVEPRLQSVMSRSFSDFKIVDYDGTSESDADFWVSYGDLAYFQRFSQATRNISKPYIRTDSNLLSYWNDKLPNSGLRVGISWRSGNMDAKRIKHYTELADWEELLCNPNLSFICLQYGDIAEEISDLPENIQKKLYIPDFDLKDDFENLGAVMANCDVVIGPSSAPVHQASAIGTDTIVYTLKGYRSSLGLWIDNDEYTDIWYRNCKNITFDAHKRNALVARVGELIKQKL